MQVQPPKVLGDSSLFVGKLVQLTTIFERCTLTSSLPGHVVASERYRGVKLLLRAQAPLTAARVVANERDFLAALRVLNSTSDDGSRFVFFNEDAVLGTNIWPAGPLDIRTKLVVACVGLPTCLDPDEDAYSPDLTVNPNIMLLSILWE